MKNQAWCPRPLLRGQMIEAEYHDPLIPDYCGNPLTEALPPIWLKEQVVDLLQYYPDYQDAHRTWPTELRLHLIRNVLKFFEVLPIHIDLEQRLSSMLRLGYEARNPLPLDFYRNIDRRVDALKFERPLASNLQSSALGLAVVGLSGVGKSLTLQRLLMLYPQVIFHHHYRGQEFSHVQVAWLKLECPFDGSTKGLCLNFFQALDDLLETNNVENYARRGRATTDEMIAGMARVASLHSLGVLVIDEIQHLSEAKSGGSRKMLNFFVELVNKIGMPVILVGTYKAMSLLNSEFRQARRSAGLGDLVWDSMKEDQTWDLFLESLWRYQYTKTECPLTRQLSHTLYDVSQGITDLAVKVYMLAQARAMTRGDEAITASVIRSVAHDSLRLARPILDALKSGNIQELHKVDDILPVDIELFLKEIVRTSNSASSALPTSSPVDSGEKAKVDRRVDPKAQTARPLPEPESRGSSIQELTPPAASPNTLQGMAAEGYQRNSPVFDALQEAGYLATDDEHLRKSDS